MPQIFEQSLKWNIFHYTNLSALPSIFRNDSIVLWATNVSYLNDPSELLYGINTLKAVENITIDPGALRNYYLTSFSQEEDSLVMWGQYGEGGQGCALGLDYDAICKSYEVVCKCIYGRDEARRDLESILSLLKRGSLVSLTGPQPTEEQNDEAKKILYNNQLINTCLSVKHEAYRHEKETRAIIRIGEKHFNLVNFRCQRGFLIPYVQIPIRKDAIKKIIIGPTLNAEVTMRSILQMLQIRGYSIDNIEIQKSSVPFRG